MPIVADAAVAIRADMSRFRGDLSAADRATKTFGQSLNAALSPRNLLTGLGIGLGIQTVTGFLGDAISAASNLNETMTKTAEIFGDEAMPALEAWAATAADTFGQSQQQALDAASTFAIFGGSAGLAGDELVDFSQDLTELASDLSSFYNTSPEEAILAIGAALRGESEPIRRYGVLLNDATLKQRALKLGLIETTTEALTPQNRVLAAQAEILAQTGLAQGDFERTSEGLANQQRTLEANLADVSAEIGEQMLPIMIDLATFANTELVPVLRDIVASFDDIGNAVRTVEDVLNFLPNAGRAARGVIDDVLRPSHAFLDAAFAAPPRDLGNTFTYGININAPTVPMTPTDIGRALQRTGVFGNVE